MQLMSILNTWIMIINMKIIFNWNANNFHLKYMNYDLKQYFIKMQIK